MADVILLCAEADRPALHPVTGGLTRAGLTSEIWSGLDVDAAQLATRMDAHGNPSLYALCASPRMETAAPALIRSFEAKKGPDDRMIRLRSWREDPDGEVRTIVDSATKESAPAMPLQSIAPSRFAPDKQPRHQRAQTYGRQQVPDGVVQRLAQDHAARSENAPSGPAPLPSAMPVEATNSRSTMIVVAAVVVAAGVAAAIALS